MSARARDVAGNEAVASSLFVFADPDALKAFTRLTLKTSTHCLMGEDFRYTIVPAGFNSRDAGPLPTA